MSTLERVARGLFAANLITAAERNKMSAPTSERILTAWRQNPLARERWTKISARILSEVPGLDLGAMTGAADLPLLVSIHRRSKAEWILDAATFALMIGGSFLAGAVLCALVLSYLWQQ